MWKMTSIFQNSVIGKVIAAVVLSLRRAAENSRLRKLSEAVHESYGASAAKRIWERFCGAADTTRLSCYGRFTKRIDAWLSALGNILRQSVFYRILTFLRDCYFKLTDGSVIFGWIHKLNLHQWVLAAFAFYLPMEYVIRDLLGIGFLASVWEELFLMGALFLVLWRNALGQTDALQRESQMGLYILLFMGAGFFLMMIVCPWPDIALAGYRAQCEYLLWFFLILRLVENDRDFKVLYGAFLCMASLLAVHGIYQYVIGVEIPSGWVSQTEMGVRTRVFSLTGSPNIFGSLLVLAAPLAAGLIYYVKKPLAKCFFLCLTGLMCLCMLFTFSKGAWLGLVVAVVLFALYIDRRLFLLMGAAVAGILVAVPSVLNRLTYLFTSDYAEASAVGGRTLRWETGRMLLHDNNPLLGFGLGRFGGAVAMNNQVLDKTEEFEYFYMDNYYLKTMVEMGYLGLAFYLLMMAALVVWGLRAVYRSGESPVPAELPAAMGQSSVSAFPGQWKREALTRNIGNQKVLAVSIFSGLCGVLVHCYFENIFEEPYMMAYFWGLAAMLIYSGFFRKPALKSEKQTA